MSDPVTVLIGFAVVAIAGLIALLALSLRARARLRAEMRSHARTDPLTGLGNRRSLYEDIERELAVGSREKLVLAILDLDGFKQYNDTFGHAAGDALLCRLAASLAEAVRDRGRAYRLGGDEFSVLAEAGDDGAEGVVAAARAALAEDGEGFAISASCGSVALSASPASGPEEALRLADRAMYVEKAGRQGRVEHETREVLLQILRDREPEASDDGRAVARLAEQTGRAVGLDAEALDILIRAATLHDIGKIAIPRRVLDKPGPLDREEWGLLRKHSVVGERILGAAPAMAPVAKAVRSTHERWDGSGYPDGLRGDEIPLASRIVLICDAFHAMTSERPYGDSRTREEAFAELRRCAGKQFDPAIVETFCAVQSGARRAEKPLSDSA